MTTVQILTVSKESRHEKNANRTNLVRGHVFEKMWTFFQNRNKSTSNHTFLEKLKRIEVRNFKCMHFGLFLQQCSHKLAIYSRKSVDSSNQENLVRGQFYTFFMSGRIQNKS